MKSYKVNSNGDLIDESTGKPYLPLPSAVAQAQAAPRERLHEMSESDRQRQQAKSTVTARLCESYRSLGLSTEEAEIAAGMTPSHRDQEFSSPPSSRRAERMYESYRALGLGHAEAEIAAGVRKPPLRTDSWGS
jgi:hypothetical protein